ncbi:MAG TPA: Maf family protein [Xanthobacteraceae bacterium]|nr:Maf family protein [Xanthobacteraceae bacterium]
MSLWLAADPLVLASGSAVRRALLEAAGVPTEVHPAGLDERSLETNASSAAPGAVAQMLAREKATAVARIYRGRLVLGADQTLALGAERVAKAGDRAAARAQLRALSGRTHELHSAIVFVEDATVLFEHVESARLTMRAFSDRFLDRYLGAAGSTATESVGAYQVEGPGIQLFERVDGDYFTILGLPLLAALDFLRRRGCLLA